MIRNPAPNPNRTALHSGPALPDGDLTPRQRAIADAVRGCHNLSDFGAKLRQVDTTVPVFTIDHLMSEEQADRRIEDGIRAARAKLDKIERTYRNYGAEAFMPKQFNVRADITADAPDRATVVRRVLSYLNDIGAVLTRAGDRPVFRDASNSYVVQQPNGEA